MRPIYLSYTPTELDADGIALSQTPLGAGNLTLNGVLASGGAVTLGDQQFVSITWAGNDAARTATVTGTNRSGAAITGTIAGANIGVTASTVAFYTVSQIAIDAATAGALTAGVNGLGYSRPVVLDQYIAPMNLALYFIPSGTITAEVQDTGDDIFASTYRDSTGTWIDHPTMTGMTTTQNGNYAFPPRAIRLNVTAATAGTPDPSAVLQIIQAGIT